MDSIKYQPEKKTMVFTTPSLSKVSVILACLLLRVVCISSLENTGLNHASTVKVMFDDQVFKYLIRSQMDAIGQAIGGRDTIISDDLQWYLDTLAKQHGVRSISNRAWYTKEFGNRINRAHIEHLKRASVVPDSVKSTSMGKHTTSNTADVADDGCWWEDQHGSHKWETSQELRHACSLRWRHHAITLLQQVVGKEQEKEQEQHKKEEETRNMDLRYLMERGKGSTGGGTTIETIAQVASFAAEQHHILRMRQRRFQFI
jgi:hypothetical protein